MTRPAIHVHHLPALSETDWTKPERLRAPHTNEFAKRAASNPKALALLLCTPFVLYKREGSLLHIFSPHPKINNSTRLIEVNSNYDQLCVRILISR